MCFLCNEVQLSIKSTLLPLSYDLECPYSKSLWNQSVKCFHQTEFHPCISDLHLMKTIPSLETIPKKAKKRLMTPPHPPTKKKKKKKQKKKKKKKKKNVPPPFYVLFYNFCLKITKSTLLCVYFIKSMHGIKRKPQSSFILG